MALSTIIKTLVWIIAGGVLLIVCYILSQFNFGPPPLCITGQGANNLNTKFQSNLAQFQDILPQKGRPQLNYVEFLPSKFVNVRAAYIDDRPRENHRNATVLLANIWKNITDNNLIVGCQIGNVKTSNFKVKVIGETPLWRAYPVYNKINHEEVLIDCFDVPSQNGDQAFLYYKTSDKSEIEVAVSERFVRRPDPYVSPKSPKGLEYNFTVVTCTKVFGGNSPWFVEWIKYQKRLGIDHVHIDVDNYFFIELDKQKMDFVLAEIKSGFLSLDPWVLWLANGKEVWYHNQGLILEDCGYRFRGTYDFMFVLDTDDFFVPRVPDQDTVHYYIHKYFKSNIGSCKMMWVEYFPDKYIKNTDIPNLQDGNVTSLLSNYTHVVQGNPKSVHRTIALVDTATHYAFKMTDGYSGAVFQITDAYVAHVRKNRQPSFHKNLVYSPP